MTGFICFAREIIRFANYKFWINFNKSQTHDYIYLFTFTTRLKWEWNSNKSRGETKQNLRLLFKIQKFWSTLLSSTCTSELLLSSTYRATPIKSPSPQRINTSLSFDPAFLNFSPPASFPFLAFIHSTQTRRDFYFRLLLTRTPFPVSSRRWQPPRADWIIKFPPLNSSATPRRATGSIVGLLTGRFQETARERCLGSQFHSTVTRETRRNARCNDRVDLNGWNLNRQSVQRGLEMVSGTSPPSSPSWGRMDNEWPSSDRCCTLSAFVSQLLATENGKTDRSCLFRISKFVFVGSR